MRYHILLFPAIVLFALLGRGESEMDQPPPIARPLWINNNVKTKYHPQYFYCTPIRPLKICCKIPPSGPQHHELAWPGIKMPWDKWEDRCREVSPYEGHCAPDEEPGCCEPLPWDADKTNHSTFNPPCHSIKQWGYQPLQNCPAWRKIGGGYDQVALSIFGCAKVTKRDGSPEAMGFNCPWNDVNHGFRRGHDKLPKPRRFPPDFETACCWSASSDNPINCRDVIYWDEVGGIEVDGLVARDGMGSPGDYRGWAMGNWTEVPQEERQGFLLYPDEY